MPISFLLGVAIFRCHVSSQEICTIENPLTFRAIQNLLVVSTQLKNMIVKLEIIPKDRGEHENISETTSHTKISQKHPADTWINEDFQVSYRDGLCFVRPFHIQLQQF